MVCVTYTCIYGVVVIIFFASFLCSFILISNLRPVCLTYVASQSLQSIRYTTFVLSPVLRLGALLFTYYVYEIFYNNTGNRNTLFLDI